MRFYPLFLLVSLTKREKKLNLSKIIQDALILPKKSNTNFSANGNNSLPLVIVNPKSASGATNARCLR